MCGIAGCIGKEQALPFLISGLKKLEYLGYDSAGIAIYHNNEIQVRRQVGKIADLERSIMGQTIEGTQGIAHTRWATHGVPSNRNSHPHRNREGSIAVVHNGIIENYLDLRRELEDKGYVFTSETDTEVLPNLIADCFHGDLLDAVWAARERLRGSYAAVCMSQDDPDKLIGIRQDSPMIVGMGKNGNYFASDIPALIGYADRYIVLKNGETAVLTADSVTVYAGGEIIEPQVEELTMDMDAAEKGGYDHFMLKEIIEQPRALKECLSGRISYGKHVVDLGEVKLTPEKIETIDKIVMVACGTAYHACYVGRYVYEKLLGIPVEVDIASEFRYRDPIVDKHTLTIIVSQSGETADTLAALAEAKRKGSHIMAITNVWGSSIAREAHDVIYTRAGLEIAVASTKAYTTQILAIYLLGLYMAETKGKLIRKEIQAIINELYRLPDKVQKIIDHCHDDIKTMGEAIADHDDAFFIGRGLDYVVALEGALKLKEISYIHAEAYAAGELKHGTLALITDRVPVISLCTQSVLEEKMISNIKEAQTRDGQIFGITFEGNKLLSEVADHICYLPKTMDLLAPILTVIPLQLIAYYASVKRGVDVDKPRNLAKSVTVE
ncbi:MAG: glutamine--fructose-6-phosphate transaminase (isomerizing) [Firmicutes bacterium]|nr:glutamine--fructose-6-phosphate transaminase (isomerizing) [Bacillota bacterium]